jgi:hypothetical protein
VRKTYCRSLALCLLVASRTPGQTPLTIKLNGGLEASILQVGRSGNRQQLTLTMRLANRSSETAYLLLVDQPMATDNSGVAFDHYNNITGVTVSTCGFPGAPASWCLGIPEDRKGNRVPIQSFTTLDPTPGSEGGINVNFVLTSNRESVGTTVSFSAHMYARFVADPQRDSLDPDPPKYREFRMMTLSFPPVHVTDLPR